MRQHLILDADDTLWENNIYFERAFDEFVAFLDHGSLNAAQVRDVLDEIELANSRVHGYGSENFGRNMVECYQRLCERHIHEEDLGRVVSFARRILDHPMELIAGVPETLAELAGRHELTLFTKGHPEEQILKVDRSGLGRHFAHTAVVKEKDAASYRRLAAERGFDPAATWMVGNSPRSDINPALEAGLNAVFIPHARTWVLEKEEIRNGHGPGKLLVLDRFADLTRHF